MRLIDLSDDQLVEYRDALEHLREIQTGILQTILVNWLLSRTYNEMRRRRLVIGWFLDNFDADLETTNADTNQVAIETGAPSVPRIFIDAVEKIDFTGLPTERNS